MSLPTMEKFRTTKFCCMLYPDEDNTHLKALEYIISHFDYAYIVHDKDQVKNHTHVVFKTSNARWNTSISEVLGIPINYIQKVRDIDFMLEYLLHYNEDNKYQYSIDEVKGTSLKKRLIKLLNTDNRSDEEILFDILSYIDNYDKYMSVRHLNYYIISNGFLSLYLRCSKIILPHLYEKNEKFGICGVEEKKK